MPNFYPRTKFYPGQKYRDRNSQKQKQIGKLFVYDRDIVCLPKSYEGATSSKVVKIPRSKAIREYLASMV